MLAACLAGFAEVAEQYVERRDEQKVEHEIQDAVHSVLGRDDHDREPENESGKRVERDRFTH